MRTSHIMKLYLFVSYFCKDSGESLLKQFYYLNILFQKRSMPPCSNIVRQLYGHLPPITKTIQVRQTRYAGHCWRSRGELISDVLLWTPTHGRAKAGQPARTYIQQLCEDTGCEDTEELPEAMNDREKWRERVRDIRATSTTWWWWWWWLLFLDI